ncbi:MAG: hypothetical protein KDA57_10840 [Planctomycetales bacterium]|nr:hypothetical protein [Planctomycetales bacterium]
MSGKLQRVAIVGGSCAGKSTLAKELSAILHLPHIELDALHWGPNWQENPRTQFLENLKSATSEPCWVCDGNYTFARELVWARAETLLWLNYSFPIVFCRALRRTIGRVVNHTELFSGNRETFTLSFLSRESILLWVVQSHHRRKREIEKLVQQAEYRHLNVIELRSPAATERFVSQIRT